MTALGHLVATCAIARQNTLDSSLSAIRAYALTLRAEAELPATAGARRTWCEDTAAGLDAVWSLLDVIRWDHGPTNDKPGT